MFGLVIRSIHLYQRQLDLKLKSSTQSFIALISSSPLHLVLGPSEPDRRQSSNQLAQRENIIPCQYQPVFLQGSKRISTRLISMRLKPMHVQEYIKCIPLVFIHSTYMYQAVIDSGGSHIMITIRQINPSWQKYRNKIALSAKMTTQKALYNQTLMQLRTGRF